MNESIGNIVTYWEQLPDGRFIASSFNPGTIPSGSVNNDPKAQMNYIHQLREVCRDAITERDEARAVARRLYAQLTSQIAIYNAAIEINAALRRELGVAATDALEARKAWGVAESECMRLRHELDTLRPRQ